MPTFVHELAPQAREGFTDVSRAGKEAQNTSIVAQVRLDYTCGPDAGGGYHPHSYVPWLLVIDGGHGLVQSVCRCLGGVGDAGGTLLRNGSRAAVQHGTA